MDDEVWRELPSGENMQRYYQALARRPDMGSKDEVYKIELLINGPRSPPARRVVRAANERAEKTGSPAATMEAGPAEPSSQARMA